MASMYKFLAYTPRKRVMFKVSDLVWVIFTLNRFLVGKYNKIKGKKKIGLCGVLWKINDNTCILCLPNHLKTYNVLM
jgi:hypothetical protein